ncbi:hypothetical protein SAMN05216388_100412 [Halorientalis persicus]|jgi:hypothetical protein|uniref:Uncharacterized protein n=1 Tax=Halorientalis persicus TaxID=1367881 RepID=A0A1H8HXB1_9EURY|nr:hypothetical protein [Halorientalis persicus]SEN60546.1 hypothetical protein SAMN05216388_100412 [Halorientalis persicus]
MSDGAGPDDVADLIADLESAHRAAESAQARVEERGEGDLEAVAEQYDRLQRLFDDYEEEATGDGDFRVFIEFQEEMEKFVDGLPEELPHRECFEEVDDIMQQRRLTESDFARAREALSPAADDAALLEEREATRNRYAELRTRAERRVRELDERIADLDALVAMGEADLDAPVERLREPIASYNDAVEAAFREFKREASARDVLGFVEATASFPLVEYRQPPSKLTDYIETHQPGTEPIPTLLEYADYSKSKLDHYVDDATALKTAIGASQTYLRRLDAEPLTVSWPPPAAAELRFLARELIQVTGRFAPEDVVAKVRTVRALTEREDYDRLRTSAQAREQLDDAERQRLQSGAVQADLDATREAREELAATLEELPG